MSLEISPETQKLLSQEARKEGVSVDALIQLLIKEHGTGRVGPEDAQEADEPFPYIADLQRKDPEAWARYFDAWVDSHRPDTPVLSDADMSRDAIYPDLL
jgi:hypothetical protein